jgi:tetratricopeptide (TPR) repeat protein
LLEKIPLIAMALVTSVATVIVQRQVGAVAGLDVLPLKLRVANAAVGYVVYVWKTIWPTHLAAFYPFHTEPTWEVALAGAALAAVTFFVINLRARYPYLFVGWLWYVVTLAPVIGLIQAGEQARADRFMYVPMVGLLIIAAWTPWEKRLKTRGSWLLGTLIVATCAVTARAQTSHWADSLALWRHAAEVTDANYVAYEKIGEALRERGQLADAKRYYEKALALAPAHAPAYEAVIQNSLGIVLIRQGQPDEAQPHFADAVRLNPKFAEAQSNYANGLANAGRFSEAVVHYRAALASEPSFADALVGLGGALLTEGKTADAIPYYREALRIDPNLAQAHSGLGGALALQRQDAEAMAHFTEALRLKPDLPSAHLNMAVLLAQEGNLPEARRHLETALQIDPNYEPARRALARLR